LLAGEIDVLNGRLVTAKLNQEKKIKNILVKKEGFFKLM